MKKPTLLSEIPRPAFQLVARMGLIKDATLQIVGERVRLGQIDEVCVALAGDSIDGSGIYPGRELHQDLTCYVPQICLAVGCIWDLVVEIRQRFGIIVRIKGGRGNHGRQYKYCVANNNFDNLMFHLLYIMAVTYDPHGVSVDYSAGPPYVNFKSKGFSCRMRHEAPVQTETAVARAQFLGWKQIHLTGQKPDGSVGGHVCFGHGTGHAFRQNTALDPKGRAKASITITKEGGVKVIEAEISGIIPGFEERVVLKQMLLEGDPTNGPTDTRQRPASRRQT